MTDGEFLKAFEDCTLAEVHHRDHIRMAWLYLRKFGYEIGATKIKEGIQRFAAKECKHSISSICTKLRRSSRLFRSASRFQIDLPSLLKSLFDERGCPQSMVRSGCLVDASNLILMDLLDPYLEVCTCQQILQWPSRLIDSVSKSYS